jgi:hypothetical protein
MDGNERIGCDLLDGLVEKGLDIGAVEGAVDSARGSAESIGLLNEVDREALIR